jgi:hypothetical protein
MLDQERGKSDSTQGYIRVRDTTMKRIFLVFLVMQHIRNIRVFRIRQRI